MLPLAHLGIGSKMVSPWAKGLPKWALLLGTVLPDFIDKPLFYLMLLLARMTGGSVGYINNSRTFAHTAIFLLLITGLAVLRRSKTLAAIAFGVATHLLLDNLGDGLAGYFMPDITHPPQQSALIALLWPFYKSYFVISPFDTLAGHMHRSINPLSLGFEVIGASILFWDYWQFRHEPEILQSLALRRRKNKEIKLKKKRPLS